MEMFHFEKCEIEKHPNRREVRIEMREAKAGNKRKLENAGRKFSFQVLSLREAVSISTARSDTPKLPSRVMNLWRTEGKEQEKIADSSQEFCLVRHEMTDCLSPIILILILPYLLNVLFIRCTFVVGSPSFCFAFIG